MNKASDEFKAALTTTPNSKAAEKKLALFDGLMDQLLELLMGLFDQCLGQLSPGEVAQRVSKASTLDKIRFRSRVRKNVYKSSNDYRANGGQHVADSVLETTAAMGQDKCTALVKELTEGENFWPNDEFRMG